MKRTIFILLFVHFFSISSDAKIKIGIQLQSHTDSTIVISIAARNTSDKDSVLFYTPTSESFCISLVVLNSFDHETGKSHRYFPCSWETDIDRIRLDKSNSVLILPGESHLFELGISLKYFTPMIRNTKYLLEVIFSYEHGNFISKCGYEIFKGTIKSNRIEITN